MPQQRFGVEVKMKRILFVEDDLSLAGGLAFAMKKQGYEPDVARTGLEAEKKWQDGGYDLVFRDVSLPDGSGSEVWRSLRKTAKVPVLFFPAVYEGER